MSTSDNVIRIELLGQTDPNSAVTIDRAMTPRLASTYSAGEWNTFCEKVDRVLEPALALKRSGRRMQWISMGSAILPMAAIGIYFAVNSPGDYNYEFNVTPIIIIGMVSVFLPVGLYVYTYKKLMTDSFAIKDELQKVVNEESNKRSDISFHLKDEAYGLQVSNNGSVRRAATTNYIECVIGNVVSQFPTAVPMGGDLYTASDMGFTGTKTTAERLQELDAAKLYMTDDDYNQKKAAILAAL